MINALTFDVNARIKASDTCVAASYEYWTVEQATEFCNELFKKHNLGGWTFEVVSSQKKRNIATCWHGRQLIEFQDRYFFAMPASEVRDTIIHEVCHALCSFKEGHGPVWKAKCLELGCRPCATANLNAHPGFREDWIVPVGQKWNDLKNGVVKKKRTHKPTKDAMTLYRSLANESFTGDVNEFRFALRFESEYKKSFSYGIVQYKLCVQMHNEITA
ncbi:hypothetical protein NCTGTJJY_CDS0284 [Serratia phage 92A1]|nr:hypothetical protein NCTGTJJY_CDS0284 [Serratia phage 92A1]